MRTRPHFQLGTEAKTHTDLTGGSVSVDVPVLAEYGEEEEEEGQEEEEEKRQGVHSLSLGDVKGKCVCVHVCVPMHILVHMCVCARAFVHTCVCVMVVVVVLLLGLLHFPTPPHYSGTHSLLLLYPHPTRML